MPTYDKDRRLRLPSISAKLAGLRGMSRQEKSQMIRIGNLIDALVVARAIANPRSGGAKKVSTGVPPPSGVITTAIVLGVEVKWNAVDFNKLQNYEVQVSTNEIFSNPTTLLAFTNRIVIKGVTGTVYVRVRTVDREGNVSTYSAPAAGSTSVSTNLFDVDTDRQLFEVRTRTAGGGGQAPELLGKDLAPESTGGKALVLVGACTGPGPISFTDATGGSVKHQITYRLREFTSFYLERQDQNMGLPTLGTSAGFYDDSTRTYSAFPGSFVDIFYIEPLEVNPAHLNVQFLQYHKGTEQVGVIKRASDSIVEF